MKRYAIWAAILFMTGGAHAQDVIKQDISVKTVTEAKVGDVLLRKGSVETIKIDASGKLNTKVFAAPQWDQTGKPLVEYDTTTGQVKAKSRYARFVPDEATGKLTVDRQVTNTGVKEFYTVPDNKTTRLSWTVDTDASEVEWDSAGKRLVFYGFGGLYMFESPPPVAWDADKKPVGVTAAYDKGALTYTILEGEYRYPVTVDPNVVTAALAGGVYSAKATYALSRDASAGDGASTIQIGQINGWYVMRSFVLFGLPSLTAVTSASMFLEGLSNHSDTDFDIYIHTSTQHNPIVVEDFDLFDGRQTAAPHNGTILNDTWNTSSYSAGWNEIIFNAAGRAVILAAASDSLKLALISSKDYSNTSPSGNEYIEFNYTGTNTPYLSITQEAAPSSPTRRSLFANDPTPIFKNDPIPIWRR